MTFNAILITGTGQGLGLALAKHYIQAGYFVYGCSRRDSTFTSKSYRHFKLDVADEFAVSSMFKEITLSKHRLDMLINNASLSQASLVMFTSGEMAEQIIKTNLLGTFIVSRDALRLMQRQRFGRIINFSSINVPLGSVGSAIYNACKAGVDGMMKTLAKEMVVGDITINSLGLSMVENTGMVEILSNNAKEEKLAGLLKKSTLNVEEIAHAISFLQSPLAKNITCQNIYFGGL